jgi:hypothetical protein
MEPLKNTEIDDKKKEALKQALIGVKNQREEAFILLTAIPEEYLPDIVEYFRILIGFKDSPSRTC